MYCLSKFFIFLVISAVFCIGLCTEDEANLLRDLFRSYNKLIRPVQNVKDKVDVKFGLSLVQIINVNERHQVMKLNVWLNFEWNDYQLRWDEAEYGGISKLRLPPDKIWKPDIVLFNNADGNYEVRYKSNVLIYPDGNITWIPPALYQVSCTIDVTYFPFDQQTCIMKFGSWTFNGDQVSLTLLNGHDFVYLDDYSKSGTWDIVDLPAYLYVYREADSPTETFINFSITIRRKSLFYTVNLILPTILISFLCVLVFYLPAEAGEKVTLGISILLSLVLFLLLVSKILPPTSLVLPLMAKYLLFTFLMNTVSILATVIIINWNFRGSRTHRMPILIRIIFLKYLPILLLMQRPKKTRFRWMMPVPKMPTKILPTPIHHSYSPEHLPPPVNKPSLEMMELSDLHHVTCRIDRSPYHLNNIPCTSRGLEPLTYGRESDNSDAAPLHSGIIKASKAVDFIAEHLKNEDLYLQTREDWKYVAMVIDRLLLYIFFIVTAAASIDILLEAPQIFEHLDQEKIVQKFSVKSQ